MILANGASRRGSESAWKDAPLDEAAHEGDHHSSFLVKTANDLILSRPKVNHESDGHRLTLSQSGFEFPVFCDVFGSFAGSRAISGVE